MSDSESDYEPLEHNPSVGPGSAPPFTDRGDDGGPLTAMDVGDRVDFKLADLLGRLRYACFDGVDTTSLSPASVGGGGGGGGGGSGSGSGSSGNSSSGGGILRTGVGGVGGGSVDSRHVLRGSSGGGGGGGGGGDVMSSAPPKPPAVWEAANITTAAVELVEALAR